MYSPGKYICNCMPQDADMEEEHRAKRRATQANTTDRRPAWQQVPANTSLPPWAQRVPTQFNAREPIESTSTTSTASTASASSASHYGAARDPRPPSQQRVPTQFRSQKPTEATSTTSTAGTGAVRDPRLAHGVPGAHTRRRLHIVLDLDHTLVNASEHELAQHSSESVRHLHSFVMPSTETGARPRYLLGLRDGLHAFLQQLEQLATL